MNIEKMLEDHLPKEIELLERKIAETSEALRELTSRLTRLLTIARAADVNVYNNRDTENGSGGRDGDESLSPSFLNSSNTSLPLS